MMNKLWFLGLPFSVPAGLIVAYIYGFLMSYLRSIHWYGLLDMQYMGIQREDLPVMGILFLATIAFVFIVNLKRRCVDRQTDFNPFRHLLVSSVSDDKRRAQNTPIPREYLSRFPEELTIGRKGNRYVVMPFLESPLHQFIFGAPGSRKTSIILNALIWFFNYGGDSIQSVLAVDAKPELSRKSVYEDRDDVIIINPTDIDSVGFDVWYGLSKDSSDDALAERATSIARSLIPDLSSENSHFSTNAQNLFIGFIMYGFRRGIGFSESVIRILGTKTQDYIAEICADPAMKAHEKILRLVEPYDGNESDEFKSIEDTLRKDLKIFDTASVCHCLSSNERMATPLDLLDGKSIFLSIPDHLLDQYKYLFGMILELCVRELMSQDEEALDGEPPVWLLFDEAGSIYLPSLHSAISRARSKHLQVSVIAQNFQQLKSLYGADQADSIYSGCKTKIVLACDNVDTARDLSALIGTYRETKVTDHQDGPSNFGRSSRNVTVERRPIMDVSDIYQLEDMNRVLVLTGGKWFIADKCTYLDIPEYAEASNEIRRYNARLHQPSAPEMSDSPPASGVQELMRWIQEDSLKNDR